MSEPTTALAAPVQPIEPLQIIAQAIQSGMKPDDLGKLMELQERHERNQSAKAFAEAITRFQAECPPIFKGRRANSDKLTFAYAGFDDVWKVVGPIATHCGIAVTFTYPKSEAGKLDVICRIRVGTHVEETTASVPIPQGKVNATQLMGQAMSYVRRYGVCAALNVIVTDEDQDAGDCCDVLSDLQRANIITLVREAGNNMSGFLKWIGATDVASISIRDYGKCVDMLDKKISRMEAEASKGGAK